MKIAKRDKGIMTTVEAMMAISSIPKCPAMHGRRYIIRSTTLVMASAIPVIPG
jgi:hypothetical protein